MSMPDRTTSRSSSQTVDPNQMNESEAQSRGIYGSSRSPTSNIAHIGRWSLKRSSDDEATDRPFKRLRGTEEESHIANNSDGFQVTNGKSRPLAFSSYQPNGPASLWALIYGLEHAREQVEVILPSRDALKRGPLSSNVFESGYGARKTSQAQYLAPTAETLAEATNRVHFWATPRQGSHPKGRTGTATTSQQPTTLKVAPEKSSSPLSTQSRTLSRDPRLRRSQSLTPMVSLLQSSPKSPVPNEASPVEGQMQGEHSTPASHPRPIGFSSAPLPQISISHEQYPPNLTGQETDDSFPPSITQAETYPPQPLSQEATPSPQPPRNRQEQPPAPASDPVSDPLASLTQRIRAFEREERDKQTQHEELLETRKRQQEEELERVLEKNLDLRRQEGEMVRSADLKRVEQEHKRKLEEVERWFWREEMEDRGGSRRRGFGQ